MADPNFAAVAEMWAFVAKVLDELETYTATSSTGVIATTEALRNDLEGDYGLTSVAPIAQVLNNVGAPLSRDGARRIMDPLLRQMAVAIGYANPQAPISTLFTEIYDYFVTNSQSFNSPEDTIDTSYAADGGNVGDAEVVVLTVDENGHTLGWLTDTWELKCVTDARTIGRTGQETWELRGLTTPRPDNLKYAGTGLITTLRTLSADLSTPYVRNPSFNDTTESSGNLTALAGWTHVTGANLYTNLAVTDTVVHRPQPGQTVSTALQFNGNETIYQDLVVTAGATIPQNVPFLIDVAVAKVGTPTGTFTLRLSGTVGSGGVSASLAHSAMTGSSTFDRLRIAIGANCWPANFNANDLKLQIALASSGSIDASNYFVIDDILFTPLPRVGSYGDPRQGRGQMGIHIGVVGGGTPSVKDDFFLATDALGGTRGVNDWLVTKICQYGRLPMVTAAAETVADK
jgi:hypothetical protein